MSGQHGITKEYFDFATDLMDELHDAIALINGAHVDGIDDIELELDEAGHHAARLLGMAAKKLQATAARMTALAPSFQPSRIHNVVAAMIAVTVENTE